MKNPHCVKNFIILALIWNTYLSGAWLERKAEGWAWYEDPQVPKKEEEVESEESPLPKIPLPSALDQVAEIRKNLEEKLAQAVLVPNEENVSLYMSEQKKSVDRASEFSKAWSKVLLQIPNLDETLNGFPVTQYGIQIEKQIRQEKLISLIRVLKEDHGLFFFYEGKNKASQALSLVVQEFSEKHDWKIIAVSRDGFMTDGFMDNRKNNGIIENLGISAFPSLFLVNPKTFEVTPIAYGLVSMDRIETNISLQFQNLKDGKFD